MDNTLQKIKRRIILDCILRVVVDLIMAGVLIVFLVWLIEILKAYSVLF